MKNYAPKLEYFCYTDDLTCDCEKPQLAGYLPENFPSPHQLILEQAEGVVAVDPLTLYKNQIGSRVQKIDCACFCHFHFRYLRNLLFWICLSEFRLGLWPSIPRSAQSYRQHLFGP